MTRVSYILLGLAPSLLWLFFYIKKDIHPEPKKKILTVFLGGGLAAVAAGGIETLLIKNIPFSYRTFRQAAFLFVSVALIEEVSKYFPFRLLVLKHEELDEPIDIPEYLITSALGFAAVENIILFFSKGLKFLETFFVSWFRFIGATLLHAVCSGILGYFIALAFVHKKRKRRWKARFLFFSGFVGSIFLHTLYNFSIIEASRILKVALPLLFLGGTGVFLSCGLGRLGRLKGVCRD